MCVFYVLIPPVSCAVPYEQPPCLLLCLKSDNSSSRNLQGKSTRSPHNRLWWPQPGTPALAHHLHPQAAFFSLSPMSGPEVEMWSPRWPTTRSHSAHGVRHGVTHAPLSSAPCSPSPWGAPAVKDHLLHKFGSGLISHSDFQVCVCNV